MSGIGGFFPADSLPPGLPGASVLDAWSRGAARVDLVTNARSAIYLALRALHDRGFRRARLPAFVCPSVAKAARKAGLDVRFHDVLPDFGPDVRDVGARDVLLFVNYFGRIPPSARVFRRRHDGVPLVEDRAQALSPGDPVGDVVVYSPRKLTGSGEGGVLVQASAHLAFEPALGRPRPTKLPVTWSAFRARESFQRVSTRRMSAQVERHLRRLDLDRLSRLRLDNFAVLARHAVATPLFDARGEGFAPLGFPIVVPNAAETQRALAARAVFAARYWPHLPVSDRDFPVTRAMAARVLVLPCDHRYGEGEMLRVARAVSEVLA
jgi:hypothetical protein